MVTEKILVGALELCDLPQLQIGNLNIRVDTGAKTSSLHVDNIMEFSKDEQKWVSFDIHPDIHDVACIVRREALVQSERSIKSSNGTMEKRYVVKTLIRLGEQEWVIELTLTDRSGMSYLMLLGRQAMQNRLIVDPSEEYLLKHEHLSLERLYSI